MDPLIKAEMDRAFGEDMEPSGAKQPAQECKVFRPVRYGDPVSPRKVEARRDKRAVQRLKNDAVVLPGHYARYPLEPIYFMGENNIGFLEGNVIKYTMRWPYKNGLEDVRKAIRYLEMIYKKAQGDPEWAGPSTLTIGGAYGYEG